MLRFFCLVCIVLVFATGCGTGYELAQGIVTMEGTPVEGAVVSFSPKEGSTGTPGVGTTNKVGKFTIAPMISGGPTSGAKVGEYLVIRLAIHSRFMMPPTKSRAIRAKQQPRQ